MNPNNIMPAELFTLYFHLGFMVILFTVVYFILTKPFAKRTDEKKEMDAVSRYLLCIGFVLIVFSFFAPYLIIQYLTLQSGDENASPKSIYDISGPLGDTIGGVMNPFVAMAGVIVTGLAFYMQYKANKVVLIANDQLKEQFKLQQFESQFYEMIRLHKENVNEMTIEGYDYRQSVFRAGSKIYLYAKKDKLEINNLSCRLQKNGIVDQSLMKKEINGRKIFYLMIKEPEATYTVVKKIHYSMYKNEYRAIDNMLVVPAARKKDLFILAYHIFFSGKQVLDQQIRNNEVRSVFDGYLNIHFHCDIFEELEVLRTCHKAGVRYLDEYICDENINESLALDFSYLPFGGHQIRLGHYYRHMLSIVKHVVDQPPTLLSYEDKRKYLKIFRAQLSNHEVVLLYYNWLADYGWAWEEGTSSNLKTNLFTDFRILHNINRHLVLKDFDPLEFITRKDFVYKIDKRDSDKLFEIYGRTSTLSEQENMERKQGFN